MDDTTISQTTEISRKVTITLLSYNKRTTLVCKLISRYGELDLETRSFNDSHKKESSQMEMKTNMLVQRPSNYCARYNYVFRCSIIVPSQ